MGKPGDLMTPEEARVQLREGLDSARRWMRTSDGTAPSLDSLTTAVRELMAVVDDIVARLP